MYRDQTPCFLSFRRNYERIDHVAEILLVELKLSNERQKLLLDRTKATRERLASVMASPVDGNAREALETEFRELDRLTSEHRSAIENMDRRHSSVMPWIAVMMVTFTEAYLQDVLAYLAAIVPSFMEKSEMRATYAEILAAEPIGISGLAAELRRRWARAFVDDGGPAKWIQKLERWGARGYDETLQARMELIWGIRHVVVHNAGTADREFVKRHAEFSVSVGQELAITPEHIDEWLKYPPAFVGTTDSFIVAITKAKLEPAKR